MLTFFRERDHSSAYLICMMNVYMGMVLCKNVIENLKAQEKLYSYTFYINYKTNNLLFYLTI